jgi:hypothetical protein
MGLDISFHLIKRADFEEYRNDLEEWRKAKPAVETITDDEYNKLSDEEKRKANEEHQKYADSRPDPEDYGMTSNGSFRKVNFLVAFFDYWDNCQFKEITLDEIKELLARCRAILKHKSKKKAEYLLPTTSGFFFGSTEYDKWYFEDVKEVREWAKSVIKADDGDADNLYLMWCWW